MAFRNSNGFYPFQGKTPQISSSFDLGGINCLKNLCKKLLKYLPKYVMIL